MKLTRVTLEELILIHVRKEILMLEPWQLARRRKGKMLLRKPAKETWNVSSVPFARRITNYNTRHKSLNRILKHWDHCDTQINIGEREIDISVSRFLTSIVFSLKRGKSNIFCSKRIFGSSMESTCLARAHMRKGNVGCGFIFQLYLKKSKRWKKGN